MDILAEKLRQSLIVSFVHGVASYLETREPTPVRCSHRCEAGSEPSSTLFASHLHPHTRRECLQWVKSLGLDDGTATATCAHHKTSPPKCPLGQPQTTLHRPSWRDHRENAMTVAHERRAKRNGFQLACTGIPSCLCPSITQIRNFTRPRKATQEGSQLNQSN